MNTTNPPAEPPGEPTAQEIARALAELELYAQPSVQQAPASRELAIPAPNHADIEIDLDADSINLPDGETKRVHRLRAEVAEAHRLVDLQEDESPLLIDSPRVRKRRRAAYEAAKLHELAQDPVMLAYRDQKVRRAVTVMVMSAASIALAVSAIGVQASVVKALDLDEDKDAFGWWAAFGVEPALSLPLLAAVGAQAYSAMRGQVVDRKSPEGKKLFRTEALLLGLTLLLNCWPAIKVDFDLLSFIVHSLGPVAAVTAVWVLPTLWQVLAVLPTGRTTTPLTGLTYRANSGSGGADLDALIERARHLISEGKLPPHPSANKVQKTLRCGMDDARAVRDALAGNA
jgi:hypothetical protein